jgi:alanyl-tRNA synthetase
MFPDTSPRLRQVSKRALKLAKDTFGCDHRLLVDLVSRVGDILGHQYPELADAPKRTKVILEHHEDMLAQAESAGRRVMPKLTAEYPWVKGTVEARDAARVYDALRRLDRRGHAVDRLSGEAAFDLYCNLGMSKEALEKLAFSRGVPFDEEGFDRQLKNAKSKSKLDSAAALPTIEKLPHTDCSPVYGYQRFVAVLHAG